MIIRPLRYFAKNASPMKVEVYTWFRGINSHWKYAMQPHRSRSTRCAICTHSSHFENSVRNRFATLFVKWNAMNEIQVVGTARNAVRLESHITVKTRFPFWAVEWRVLSYFTVSSPGRKCSSSKGGADQSGECSWLHSCSSPKSTFMKHGYMLERSVYA